MKTMQISAPAVCCPTKGLPVVRVDGAIVIVRRYPTNAEFVTLLELPQNMLHIS